MRVGAAIAIGLTEIGMRSTRPLWSLSTSAPDAYAFSGAVVRVSVTVSGWVWPGLIVKNCPCATVALTPDRPSKETVQRVAVESMLLNTRVVESEPANLLNEIDARLRSFGRFVGMLPLTIVGSWYSRYSR